MKPFLKRNSFLCFLLASGLLATMALAPPRDEVLARLLRQLADYQENQEPEKVYLQLDKPYYFAGDDLWFTAYVVNAATHRPDTASGVLYVELLDAKGAPVAAEKVKLSGGTGHGDFALGQALPTAHYRLRAYTRWMQNGKPDFFFTRTVPIVNPAEKQPDAPTPADETAAVQFFPEGGDLVAGLPATVAFKATDRHGHATPATLLVTAADGTDTVGTFGVLERGLGAFSFTPAAGRSYKAMVRTASGRTQDYALPAVRRQGYVLHAESTPDAVQVTVRAAGMTATKLHIVAQTRGKATYETTGQLTGGVFVAAIPKVGLPTGITQITVFDSAGTPQCERLVFVNHHDHARLQLTADRPAYGPRQKVTITLTARDAAGRPLAGNFSLSVADAETFVRPEHTLLASLLLTSDLKGHVADPGFYLEDGNAATLDLLLLTHGWRRFTWAELARADKSAEPAFAREPDIAFMARLMDKSTGRALPAQILLVSAPGTESVFRYGYTDRSGSIYLNSLDFYDYRNVIVSVYDKGLVSSTRVVTDSLAAAPPAAQPLPAFTPPPLLRRAADRQAVWAVLRRTYPPAEASGLPLAGTDSLRPVAPIYAKADDVLKLDDFTLFPTMEEVIRDIVPWGLLTHKKAGTGFRMLNTATKLYFKNDPLFLIDNVPMRTMDPVLGLDPASVYSIECVRSAVGRGQFGEIGFNGIFSVFTKAGDFYPSNEPGLYNFPVRGFQKARQYYSPRYDAPEAARNQPDFRNLLYWNPAVSTDAAGRATVTFYTSDDLTSWRAVAEGVTTAGPAETAFWEGPVTLAR